MDTKICYLIDDDPDEKFIFEEALRDLRRRVNLVWQQDCQKALEELKQRSLVPDYIFLDINMPKLSGWRCLEYIREIPHLKKSPVVIYSTAVPESLHGITADESDIVTYLRKTSTIDDLTRALAMFFDRASA